MNSFNIESLIGREVNVQGSPHRIEAIVGRWVRAVSDHGHVANLSRDLAMTLAGVAAEDATAAVVASVVTELKRAARRAARHTPKPSIADVHEVAARANRAALAARPEAEAETSTRSMAEAFADRRAHYVSVEVDGHTHVDSGDQVAQLLRGKSPEELVALCAVLLDDDSVADRWSHLNPGQRSMNARNRIRAAFRRGDLNVAGIRRAVGGV